KAARAHRVPVFVIGVGTTGGGVIPIPGAAGEPDKPSLTSLTKDNTFESSLDRVSLRTIATAGNGRHLELGREPDLDVANQIIDAARRQAGNRQVQERTEDLYWQFLVGAAALATLGIFVLREPPALAILVGGVALTIGVLIRVLG